MKTVIIHHSADLDGLSSGHSVRYILNTPLAKMVGWDYKDPIDTIKEELELAKKEGSQVYITDISFPPEVMLEFKEIGATWIDHHISAIKDSEKHGYEDMLGLRVDGTAACELVWDFFKKTEEMPEQVKLLSKYDTFNKDDDWERVLSFQETMKDYTVNHESMSHGDWTEFFKMDSTYVQHFCDVGEKLLEKKRKDYKNQLILTREISFEGVKFIAKGGFGSSAHFEGLDNEKDFGAMMLYSYQKDSEMWKISMYGFDHSLADLSLIAKKHGGGGHKKACGFMADQKTMSKILKNEL